MAHDKYTGQVKKIRAWLLRNPSGDQRDFFEEFGGLEMQATLRAVEYLEKRQELVMADALYNFRHRHGNAEKETRQTAIFTVMRNLAKGGCLVVSFKDIIDTAVVDPSYARRYMKFLEALGLIRIRKNTKGETHIAVFPKVFKLTEVPRFNQRQERKKNEAVK